MNWFTLVSALIGGTFGVKFGNSIYDHWKSKEFEYGVTERVR